MIQVLVQKLRTETETNQLLGWRGALRFISLITLFACLITEVYYCSSSNSMPSVVANAKNVSEELFSKVTDKLNIGNVNVTINTACSKPICVCWPVVLGQEMYKLLIGWLIGQLGTILGAILMKYTRGWINSNVKNDAQRGCCSNCILQLFETFDLTDNVLKVVSWQTVCWLGCFYSPMLPLIVLG